MVDGMKTFSVAAAHVPGPTETAIDALAARAATAPDEVGFCVLDGRSWAGVTYAEFVARARRLARGLIASGIAPGQRVALMSRTRIEWALCDYAIWMAAAVTVPIYDTSSVEQVQWILADSAAAAVIVETGLHAQVATDVQTRVRTLQTIWQLDGGDLDALAERGDEVPESELAVRRGLLGAASLATIVYTSGTTGRPKGCALTHGNLISVFMNTQNAPGIPDIFNERSSTLLFLPLAHCLARIIHLSCINCGVRIAYAPDTQDLPKHLASFRPTVLLSVPRVFEKLYNSARHRARQQGRAAGWIFDRAEQVAIAYSQALAAGGPSIVLRLQHELYERLVYRQVRAAMGGRLRWSLSGGAPLGARLGHFFRGAGVTVLEGYGLTETVTGGTLNLPGRQKVGSVGPPIPGCEVGIAADGEVLLRGGSVMSGYWGHDAAAAGAGSVAAGGRGPAPETSARPPVGDAQDIDADGWLHTGDLGDIDGQGYLSITGRKKDLLITAGGKNVAPTVLEDRLRANELVSQCIVVGDARPFIGCLLTLDLQTLMQWRTEHGRPEDADTTDLRGDSLLRVDLQLAVDRANEAVSQAESIRRWQVLDHDFTEAAGELTPSLKLKRTVITTRYQKEVEDLYT